MTYVLVSFLMFLYDQSQHTANLPPGRLRLSGQIYSTVTEARMINPKGKKLRDTSEKVPRGLGNTIDPWL